MPHVPVTTFKVNDAEEGCQTEHRSNIGCNSTVLCSVMGHGLMYRSDSGSKGEGVVLRMVMWKFVSPAL